MFSQLAQDLRYGLRTLLLSRAFTAATVITLSLGIGATTAIFSVVDAVLLRPLQYPDPKTLVTFFEDRTAAGDPRARISPPSFVDLKAQRRLFQDVAALNETAFNLSGVGGNARQLNGVLTTYNLFSVLGVKPLLGRTFLPEEDRPGGSHVALLSYSLWQSQFGGDLKVVGSTVRLNSEPFTIVGVMPSGFSFPEKEVNPIDVWTPRAFTAEELSARRARYLFAVGRVQPGVSVSEINAALRIVTAQAAHESPNEMQGVSRFFAEPLQDSDTHEAKRGLLMLLVAVGFILLITCGNVANLLVSRGIARSREIALRMALGAQRSRIIRQLLTESALLSAIGGILGTVVTIASLGFLKRLVPADLSSSVSLRFSFGVFAFTILVCLLSTFLFGLVPALQTSKADLNETLREGGRGTTVSKQVVAHVLVAGEIALSLMLLIGAGLLLKSLYKLQHVALGFEPTQVLTLDLDMGEPRYRDWAVRMRFQQQVLERVRLLPAVQSTGFTGDLPLTSNGWAEEITPENSSAHQNPTNTLYGVVTPGYLEALGVRLLRGRFFNDHDGEDAQPVVIVTQKAAQDFWPNQNPIGKRLKLGRVDSNNPWLQVVGVTTDVKHAGLNELSRAGVYCPYLQARTTLQWQRFLVVRANGHPRLLLNALRQVVASIDSDEPLNHVATMTELIDRQTLQSRTQTILLGTLAGLALIMASVGIYGAMAYLVTQRRQEIGLRMALGAQRGQILGMVLKRGLTLMLAGVTFGIVASVAFTKLMYSLLFGVSTSDIGVMSVVTIILIGTATGACLIPARRAAMIDPIEALRVM